MTEEQVALNKIYRAVHDGVCPNCGGDLHISPSWSTLHAKCDHCMDFIVSRAQMEKMQDAVKVWGEKAVRMFKDWQQRNPA